VCRSGPAALLSAVAGTLATIPLHDPPDGRRRRAQRGSGDQLHDEILDAATELLLEDRNAKAVSIRSVTQRVGVTAVDLSAFRDKDALLDAVCTRYFEKLDAEMPRVRVRRLAQGDHGVAGGPGE
jgi:AcrR family transcriptional regulator